MAKAADTHFQWYRPRMKSLLTALLVAWCSASSASEPSPPAVQEFQPTPGQLKDYYDVYDNADVRYVRAVFGRALAGKEGKEEEACAPHKDYLSRRFIVLSRDPALGGGTEIYILFQGKADRIGSASRAPTLPLAGR